jgi:hypothetical protein
MARYFLVAGIDFGTSFSKVVLRQQGTPQAVVVRFPTHPNGLLDSQIGIAGACLLPPGALDDAPCIQYLKMLAAHGADGTPLDKGPIRIPAALAPMRKDLGDPKTLLTLLAFYFAHVMAATRDFITRESPWRNFDFSNPTKDVLVFQLAVPTGLLDNHGATERLFRAALIAAHKLHHAVDPELRTPRSYQTWAEEVADALKPGSEALEKEYQWQCLHYPEVLAALQAVFRSPNPQQDGLYMTMDVGAGTVELNAFRRNTGEHIPPVGVPKDLRNHDYYSLKVAPLGIHNFQEPYALSQPRSAKEVLAELRLEVKTLYHKATVRQPNHGPPGGIRTWDRARLLIFGGGAKIPPYRDSFRQALDEVGFHSPQIFDLPAATDLQLPPDGDFGRFAVAYGMSFFRKNLDDWRPPDAIVPFNDLYPPDDTPPPIYGITWED